MIQLNFPLRQTRSIVNLSTLSIFVSFLQAYLAKFLIKSIKNVFKVNKLTV